jgi:hypothetical protein
MGTSIGPLQKVRMQVHPKIAKKLAENPTFLLEAFHQKPKAGVIVGRLVAGYAELEYDLMHVLAWVLISPAAGRGRLHFVDLEEAAKGIDNSTYTWKYVDMALLKKQEKYFRYTSQCLSYLSMEFKYRAGIMGTPLVDGAIVLKPERLPQPMMHMTQDQPWSPS